MNPFALFFDSIHHRRTRTLRVWKMVTPLSFLLNFTVALANPSLDQGEKLVTQVIDLLNKMYPTDEKLTSSQLTDNEKVKEQLGSMFDIDTMSKRALSKHFDKTNEKDLKEFKDLFRQFVVRNATSNASSKKAEIKIRKREAKDKSVFITTRVRRKGTDPILMKYELLSNSTGELKIVDLVLDEESVMNEYQLQFDEIIRKNTMTELLSRIRKSLKDKHTSKKATRI